MNNKNYYVYLHSCWFSQSELLKIFKDTEIDPKIFYRSLNYDSLSSYIKNIERRNKILETYKNLDTKSIDEIILTESIVIITIWDSNYPQSLLQIPHIPFILYIKWVLPSKSMFAVVWSRKMSNYWKKSINKIIPDVWTIFPVVSWGAIWCDSEVHKTALDNNIQTIVVVWTGIDKSYPAENKKLFEDIANSWWSIVSIFRLWESPNPYNFPVRNEIVVWLSTWVLVVEAQERSWSLITAWLSLDLWKDLFAIPGDIHNPLYIWTNNLIKNGEAKCVLGSIDILEEYDFIVKKEEKYLHTEDFDELEWEIFELISLWNINIDEITEKLKTESSEIMMKISLLEMKGILKKDIWWAYTLA